MGALINSGVCGQELNFLKTNNFFIKHHTKLFHIFLITKYQDHNDPCVFIFKFYILSGSNNTQSISPGPSKPNKSLDEEFKDCFDAWNVDTASEPVFGLWREPGESAILADYQLNKTSSQLPVSWSSVKYSKHICSGKCPNSRKRKIY